MGQRPIPKAALDYVVETLKDESTFYGAAFKGEGFFFSPLAFARGLNGLDPDAKAAVAKVAVPILTKALKDEDTDAAVRRMAALYLIALDKPNAKAATAILTDALKKDEDDEVRRTAAHYLIALDESSVGVALPVLLELVDRGSDRALGVLEELGPAARGAAPALVQVLKDESQPHDSRRRVANLLASYGPDGYAAVPVLAAALSDVKHRPAVDRLQSARVLGQIGPGAPGVVPALTAALKDPDLWVRGKAARCLIDADKKRYAGVALPVLMAALRDRDKIIHAQTDVVIALGDLGPAAKDAVPDLIQLLADTTAMVDGWQRPVMWLKDLGKTLGSIGPAAEAALLDAARNSPDPRVRKEAAGILRQYYPAAAKKLP